MFSKIHNYRLLKGFKELGMLLKEDKLWNALLILGKLKRKNPKPYLIKKNFGF